MLLDNILEFKKEDCVLVAIKFDIKITTVVNKRKVASILSTSKLDKAKQKREKSMLKQTRNSKL